MSGADESRAAARAAARARVEAQRARSMERVIATRTAASERLAARRQAAREALEGRQPEGGRRRRWPWLVLLLLLLLLVPDCQCREPAPGAPPPTPTPSLGPAGSEPLPVPARQPRAARPGFQTPTPEPMTWVESFHLQVSARAPRLSACFVGAVTPGTLRWSTAVTPSTGRVGDHELEPVLTGAELSREQRDCVLGVLSEPAYQVSSADAPATPVRVGLVLEF